ncbi:hypothetical protein HHK36_010959 [Tetracentron sinense]|uniref:UDP-glucuronate decarboxylase n=1 Tax=Tetracentron sinense TaxID=13715 RepID=A0A834ZAG2_TETSI|nr:hypothetical protein HHK36_010959 [Tetracentron sinense]
MTRIQHISDHPPEVSVQYSTSSQLYTEYLNPRFSESHYILKTLDFDLEVVEFERKSEQWRRQLPMEITNQCLNRPRPHLHCEILNFFSLHCFDVCNCEVIVADNYFTGSKDNLRKWIGHPRFELIRHDVTEPLLIEVDQIYHLACPASPIFYKYNPVKTIKTNVIGTLNMLGLAKRVGASMIMSDRILLTSTSEVYGDPLVHPQDESYWGNVNPIGVRSCYDEGKRVAETLMFDYHRQHGIEIRIARIFNTYGPRMNIDDGRVVSNFIAQALRGEPLTVQAPGTQTRSFCYVSDNVDGLIRLMEGEHIGPINIGNPGEFTMLELAETVKELIDPEVEIKVVENTPDDPRQRKPDITKARELLGWEPKIKLRDGLPLMEEDFRLRLGVPKK